ncbi:unnamed protein product [Camellia sinensis]
MYKNHHPPSMLDKVWRLKKISKNEARHKRLSRENVHSVKDFLTLLFINPTKLRNILVGGGGGVCVVSFDDEAFLTDGLLQLFNNDLHFNSAMVEKSDGSKILTSQTIGGLDYPQPSVYSADIMPSIYSVGCVNSLDDFGFSNNIDSMDLGYDRLLDCCDQFENSLVCETKSITQTFYEDDRLQRD